MFFTFESGKRLIMNRVFIVARVIVSALIISCQSPEGNQIKMEHEDGRQKLVLKVAGYDLDRIKGIYSGKIQTENCDIDFHKVGIGDANTSAFSGENKYDVTEIGLHPFMLAYANDNFRGYTLIPVFPLRAFRHKSIFVRSDKGIESPEDLKAKRIGTPGYSSTSLTWIRGILNDEYGVSPKDIHWLLSNKDSSVDAAGKISKEEQIVPDGVSVTLGSPGKDESELLLSGEVDALFHAAEPEAYVQGNPLVKRLFEDFRTTERAYFSKTGIFPIMHAVAIKTELIEKYPWLPQAVFEAYSKAKAHHFAELKKVGWAYSSLPWFSQEFEETRKVMGENFWPYGIEANRKTLETLFRYSYEQGLTNRQLTVEELFDKSTLELQDVF